MFRWYLQDILDVIFKIPSTNSEGVSGGIIEIKWQTMKVVTRRQLSMIHALSGAFQLYVFVKDWHRDRKS